MASEDGEGTLEGSVSSSRVWRKKNFHVLSVTFAVAVEVTLPNTIRYYTADQKQANTSWQGAKP